MKGVFLVFEGGDGCGKTTQAKMLLAHLYERGCPVHIRKRAGDELFPEKEPQEGPIRDRLLAERSLDPFLQAHLVLQDRQLHVRNVIRPALREGKIVICDRFSPSTLAYQGGGDGISIALLRAADAYARGGLWPDRVILIDGAPAVFRSRIVERGEALTAFEQKPPEYHERVRQSYLDQARQDPDRWCVVSGEQSADAVFAYVLAAVEDLFLNV